MLPYMNSIRTELTRIEGILLEYSHRKHLYCTDCKDHEIMREHFLPSLGAGAWATDDVLLINIPDNILSTSASTKEGGITINGSNDAASEVDANATYNLRFNGNVFVDGNNLELIDVNAGLQVYFIPT